MDFNSLYEQVKKIILPERLEKIEEISKNRTRHITVILEDIHYTQNISAIIRSCDCFGVQDLTIMGHSRQRVNKHVSLGANQWVDLHRRAYELKTHVIQDFKNRGYRIYATALSPKAVSIEDFELNGYKMALVMGNELNGVSAETIDMADGLLKIPMCGFSDSLNISVSTAILIQHLVTKLKKSNSNWQLSKEELTELRYRWVKTTLNQGERIEKILTRELAHPNDQ